MGIESEGYNVSAAVSAGFVKNDASGNLSFGELGGGGGGGGFGTGWELIEVKNIAVDTTSVTFSGLDGDTDGQYMLLYRIRKIPVTGGNRRVSIQPNGISTSQNSLGRFHAPNGTNATSSFTLLNIAAFSSGALQQNFGVLILDAETGSQGRLYTADVATFFSTNVTSVDGQRRDHYAGIWNDSVTNITSLDFVSDFANGIGAGSQFCLYRKSSQTGGGGGALQLIETINVTTAVTSVSFAGLDGDTDKKYKLIYRILKLTAASTGAVRYDLRPNGATTGFASTIGIHSSGGVHTSVDLPTIRLHQGGAIAFDGDFFGEMLIDAEANTGALRRYFSGQGFQSFPSFGTRAIVNIASEWSDLTTNITSLDIVATEALAIAAGSTFSLYRVNT